MNKKFIVVSIILFQFISALSVLADNFKVTSFTAAPNDLSARKYEMKDINEDVCAIIKVRTDIPNVVFNATPSITDTKYQNETKEVWLYVSPGTKKINISKTGYITFDYPIPSNVRIESNNVYVMVLEREKILGTLTILPGKETTSGAGVFLDDKQIGTIPVNGYKIEEGNYKLKIEKKGFITLNKEVSIIGNSETKITEALEELQIYVFIQSDPVGSEFSIDNKPYGITPNNIPLKMGSHVIELKKDKYLPTKETFLVDENTKFKEFRLNISDYQPTVKAYRRNSVFMYSSLAVVVGGVGFGAYKGYTAYNNLKKYETATTEATQLHQDIIADRNLMFISLGAAAVAYIPYKILKKEHKNLKVKLNSLSYVPISNGGLVTLNIGF